MTTIHSRGDLAIIRTADDALVAKIACVERGYYQDDFLLAFEHGSEGHRYVQPLIKRGTYGRVCCMDKVLCSYANQNGDNPLQVVVLGSGKDTTFFRYLNQQLTSDIYAEPSEIRWFEVDHASVMEEKCAQIRKNVDVFSTRVEEIETMKCRFRIRPTGETTVSNTLVGHDLRENPTSLLATLSSLGLDNNIPTLFLCECVLMYMPEPETKSLLAAIAHACPNAVVTCYEPILGTDPFGSVMEKNLTKAGVTQTDHCLVQTRSIAQHRAKLCQAGFSAGVGCTMSVAYESILSVSQQQKASRCEFLDELEEWMLIMQHYCFIVASKKESQFGCELVDAKTIGFNESRSEIF